MHSFLKKFRLIAVKKKMFNSVPTYFVSYTIALKKNINIDKSSSNSRISMCRHQSTNQTIQNLLPPSSSITCDFDVQKSLASKSEKEWVRNQVIWHILNKTK
jgi:hypothetical protein